MRENDKLHRISNYKLLTDQNARFEQYKRALLVFYDKIVRESEQLDLEHFFGESFDSNFVYQTAKALKKSIVETYTTERCDFFINKNQRSLLRNINVFSMKFQTIPLLSELFSCTNIDLIATTKFFIPYIHEHTRNKKHPIYHFIASLVLCTTDITKSSKNEHISSLISSYADYMVKKYQKCFYFKRNWWVSCRKRRKKFFVRFFPIDMVQNMTRIEQNPKKKRKLEENSNKINNSPKFSQIFAQSLKKNSRRSDLRLVRPAKILFLTASDININSKQTLPLSFTVDSYVYILTGIRIILPGLDTLLLHMRNKDGDSSQHIIGFVQNVDIFNYKSLIDKDFWKFYSVQTLIYEREIFNCKKVKK